ncbi:GyrI-like domain-containing protein [Bacillus sp. RAR_GA_16]|uniref:GyrI-like domain-containing protein n=1 Tax=Bacillus sp. RAR_GA_16 TaxID=2876774 RepID=UPI001CC97E03|nr:GyrI-like domain-containing protein [Bacillus sp. RAR_GA_16]MCA0173825.1 GyrI-like domain-containing protein [Bacillus sp. RAR_GA_16]
MERNVHIETLGQLHLVGIRVRCPGEAYVLKIPLVAKQLDERKKEIAHVLNLPYQIGAFVVETSSEEEEGYWVCYQVKKIENVPDGMVAITVPSQSYAVMKHQGSNKNILHTYEELHHWIEKSGSKRKLGAWHLERFYHYEDTEQIEVDLLDTIQDKSKEMM